MTLKGEIMKVVAINASPNKDKGNTALILNPFLEGMEDQGAEVEKYFTSELKINPCQGDLNCMKTTDKCFQDDDMEWLLPIIRRAEILVFASPLYCDGVSGPMKMFMDRLVPMVHLTMEIRNGRLRHPPKKDLNVKKAVLVSNCGFWEIENFDPMKAHIKAFCDNINAEYVGELLRPHGPILEAMLKNDIPVNDVLEAARQAGNQLIRYGKMFDETINNISRPLISRDDYLEMGNQHITSG
jgi:multimeric flavodoxin WrbA